MSTESTGLLTACRAAEASFHVFFTGEAPVPGTFAERLGAALSAVSHDLDGISSANLFAPPDDASDSIDALNLSGDCGLSVPAAIDPASALPVGIQLIAPAMEEKRIFRAGRAFELARAQKDFTAPLS